MKKLVLGLLSACVVSASASAQVYREVVVDLASTGQSREQVEALFSKQVGAPQKSNLIERRFLTMWWSESRDFSPLTQELSKSTRVLSWQGFNEMMKAEAVPTPNDFLWSVQWSLNDKNVGINLLQAWEFTQGNTTPVAVIDTGVNQHLDLGGKVLPGYDFIADTLNSNDGDGVDGDASDSGNFAEIGECGSNTTPGRTTFKASNWHGTAVSGIIAAIADNTDGMVGISQGARILPLRALGKCGGYTTDVWNSVAWAAGMSLDAKFPKNPNPSRILNMSLGGERTCTGVEAEFYKQVASKQVIVVAAAGNNNTSSDMTPASCPGVIAVSSHDSSGNRASYSSFGFRVDISAPGGDQLSTSKLKIPTTYNTGGRAPIADSYQGVQGTSFSAPHVSGVVHLMLSKNPFLTVGQVGWLLERSARPFLPTSNCFGTKNCGAGMLNAYAALNITPLPLASSTASAATLTAVEYYYAPEDRYFLSTDAAEQAAIDAGAAGAFTRTGMQFKAFSSVGKAPANTTQVCRFYGRPDAPGPNSHFFTANSSECTGLVEAQALTSSSQARWNYEGQAFQIFLPVNGACAADQKPVYRAYNNGYAKGKASNHRFVSDLTTYQGMSAKGWALEGIAMCSF